MRAGSEAVANLNRIRAAEALLLDDVAHPLS